ncbi:hypothetical protein BH23CHL2_BH23CHL2_11480 [soil metagenome]
MQPISTAESQSSSRSALRGSLWHIVSTAAPVLLLTIFAVIHIQYWLETGSFVGLGLAAQESVLIVLFLIRRTPKTSLNTYTAWSAALIGSYGVLLVQPGGHTLLGATSFFTVLQIFGAALAIVTAVSLGRSFGIVAANRGVKTSGAYGIVRHLIYASYLVGYLGYLLATLSVWNVAIVTVALAFQIQRIHQEESVLMQDPEYQAYAARVPYRLIPGIY